jgi:hypothetical protein
MLTVALLIPAALRASDATFRAALNTWSNRLSADAATVGLAAKQRHPRLMTTNAVRFHRDALRARAAISAQKVTLPRVRKARLIALRAFLYYARAGTEWAASGRARLSHNRTASIADAKAAARDAAAGSRLLVSAGTLAR